MRRAQRPTSLRMRAPSPLRWMSATCPHVQTGAPSDPGADPEVPVSRIVPLGSKPAQGHSATEQPPEGRTRMAREVPA